MRKILLLLMALMVVFMTATAVLATTMSAIQQDVMINLTAQDVVKNNVPPAIQDLGDAVGIPTIVANGDSSTSDVTSDANYNVTADITGQMNAQTATSPMAANATPTYITTANFIGNLQGLSDSVGLYLDANQIADKKKVAKNKVAEEVRTI
ncbi:hypothetical protein K8R42_00085 [bacterium]|nr:hypothetical protein [bacterium]